MSVSVSNPTEPPGSRADLVGFGHGFTLSQLEQITTLIGPVGEPLLIKVPTVGARDDLAVVAESVVAELRRRIPSLESRRLVVDLPGLSSLAAAVLVELHGVAGHFPLVVRRASSGDGHFNVVEVIDLDGLRLRARARR